MDILSLLNLFSPFRDPRIKPNTHEDHQIANIIIPSGYSLHLTIDKSCLTTAWPDGRNSYLLKHKYIGEDNDVLVPAVTIAHILQDTGIGIDLTYRCSAHIKPHTTGCHMLHLCHSACVSTYQTLFNQSKQDCTSQYGDQSWIVKEFLSRTYINEKLVCPDEANIGVYSSYACDAYNVYKEYTQICAYLKIPYIDSKTNILIVDL